MNTAQHHGTPPSVLTFKEFRQALKCSRSTGYRLVWSGKVEAVKIGGRLKILTASVSRLLASPEEIP